MPSPPFHEPVDQPYNQALLTLALRQAGDRLTLLRSAPQTWARQVRELQQGLVDVAPLPALDGAYQGFALRRVDFPLRPGLLGLRLLLVRKDRVAELSRIDSLERLQRELRLGYGADWADRELMHKLGFRLVPARSTEALFASLRNGDCDLLSRGLNEVDGELRLLAAGGRDIAVLPGVALHYPARRLLLRRAAPRAPAGAAARGPAAQPPRRQLDGAARRPLRASCCDGMTSADGRSGVSPATRRRMASSPSCSTPRCGCRACWARRRIRHHSRRRPTTSLKDRT